MQVFVLRVLWNACDRLGNDRWTQRWSTDWFFELPTEVELGYVSSRFRVGFLLFIHSI
jgi:hypothetical protein